MSDYEEFLKAYMVKDGDIIVLLDAGVFKEPEETGFQNIVFHIRVELPDKRRKTWSMNKTTRNRLAKAWGDDSVSWVNRKVRLQILKQNRRGGEVMDVIYGYPIEDNQSTQASLQAPTTQLVRFIKAYEAHQVEDVINLPKKEADSLITLGYAIPVDVES